MGHSGGETSGVMARVMEDQPVPSPTPATTTTYQVYRQRWSVLITVTLLNISNAGLWINIAPVAYKAADYYNVNLADVNWFSLIYLFVSIPFCFISTFSVNKLGLRSAIHIGSALNCVGAIIRALATTDAIFSREVQFPISLAGQVIAGMAQPFLLFIPTKVSQLWFPEDARALSTTILALSNPLGILITQVVSPALVGDYWDIPTLNYVFGGLAVATQAATLLFITRSKPPTPPSNSAGQGERDRAPYMDQLKTTFTCVPYLLLLLALGCGVAFFSSLATVTAQILCPLGYDDMFAGICMALMILLGFVGSAITGIMADRTKAFTPITKLCYGLAAISAIIMLELFNVPEQPVAVAIFSGVFGIFGVGAYPIGLELAVEATYPVEESISTAFIFMSGQVQGVIIIAMVSLLSTDLKPKYEDIQVCTKGDSDIQPKDYTISLMAMMVLLCSMVVMVIAFFDTPYKRLEAERESKSSSANISKSSSDQSLTATSGYASENVSRDNTTSSRLSTKKRTSLPMEKEEVEVLLHPDTRQAATTTEDQTLEQQE